MKTLSELQIPKMKCYRLQNIPPYVAAFTSDTHLTLFCLVFLKLNLYVMPVYGIHNAIFRTTYFNFSGWLMQLSVLLSN